MVADACWVLGRWKNKYGNKDTRLTEANDDMAFVTMGNQEKKGNKKKEIMFYKCAKSGHYSNECDEEDTVKASNTSNTGKKGSNFLVLKKDIDDSSSEDDDEAVSTFSDDEESQSFDRDEKELPYKENDDDNDDNEETDEEYDDKKEETDEENNDKKDDTDDDDCDEYTDTDDDYEGFVFLKNDVMCSLQDKAGIPMSWILLDSQTTVEVFSNKKLLSNIRDLKPTLTLYCNAGKAIITQKGDFLWFCLILPTRHHEYSVLAQC